MNPLTLTLIALPCAVSAVTMQPYTPGGSPCAGACTQTWAEAEFGVPPGDPAPLTVPAGSRITMMSYARDGVPYAEAPDTFFGADQDAVGYSIGGNLWMVRIAACQNWAVVMIDGPVQVPVTLAGWPEPPTAPKMFTGSFWPSPPAGEPQGPTVDRTPWIPLPPVIVTPDAPSVSFPDPSEWPRPQPRPDRPEDHGKLPPSVAPVPLPAGAWLLALALGMLWRMKR